MEEKLDFSVPEKKKRGSLANIVIILLLVLLVTLVSADLLTRTSSGGSAHQATAPGLSAGQTKRLAAKLAQRNLYHRAAEVWKGYLANADLTDAERARALFQVGMALEKADLFAEAIEYYYRSETVALLDELAPQINSHVKGCFEKLGKFSALQYELMDRTALDKSQATGAPGGEVAAEVVAEIGAEKITRSDLDALIENAIDNQLSPMAAFMTSEQLNEQKKKMLEQYQNPQAKQQFLQSWLAQEILYRQALEERLADKAGVKRLLDELARGALSQQLMNEQLASKINITETDLQTYYTANKDKYVEPAKARISHILVTEKQQAEGVIKSIKEGGDFAELAKEHSRDDDTKDKGGKIDIDVTEGSGVPVIGDANGLAEQIFAADAPELLNEPFETEKGWEIVKVDSKQESRQKTFDEVRQQVMMMLADRKRQDVQQDYIKQMMDKYGVIVHTSVLAPSKAAEPKDDSPAPPK